MYIISIQYSLTCKNTYCLFIDLQFTLLLNIKKGLISSKIWSGLNQYNTGEF